MRFIYSLLMYLLMPYLFLRLWIKGRRLPEYKNRINERFAFSMKLLKPVDVWVHAVSLGEAIAATPLIEALLAKKWSVMVTTMTPTGSDRVIAQFADRVSHCYIPYDLPYALRRFFNRIKPKVGIIMETELWPNMIYEAKRARVSLILANGRLSQRSCRGYMKCRWFFKPLLNQFTIIGTQTSEDAERFILLGADKERVSNLGNIKFDLQTHCIDSDLFQELKKRWGKDRVTIILASTHENEEAQILSHLNALQTAIPNMVLLIAPRHPERFKEVYQLCLHADQNTGLRSAPESLSTDNQVVVLDSLGELLGFYQVSDYAFVGGSLVPIGGHNVLEPIAMDIPVLSGMHVHHFKTICADLKAANAIIMVKSGRDLVERLIQLHQNEVMKHQLISNASEVLARNKGALEQHLRVVEQIFSTGGTDTADKPRYVGAKK